MLMNEAPTVNLLGWFGRIAAKKNEGERVERTRASSSASSVKDIEEVPTTPRSPKERGKRKTKKDLEEELMMLKAKEKWKEEEKLTSRPEETWTWSRTAKEAIAHAKMSKTGGIELSCCRTNGRTNCEFCRKQEGEEQSKCQKLERQVIRGQLYWGLIRSLVRLAIDEFGKRR